jgi:MscS family membrane protein
MPGKSLGRTSVIAGMKTVRRHVRWLRSVGLSALLLCVAYVANATDNHPLRPLDTSSPRATLQGFIETTDAIYRDMADVLADYADSDRLYPTAEERRRQLANIALAEKTFRYLDLSQVPPVLMDTLPAERLLQLREILDRIDLPAMTEIPDQEAMARQPTKRWRLPNTEIDIVRIENGSRAGEYLISADTIDRLGEFYRRVRNLPYKPGPGEQLSNVYRKLSHSPSATIYEAFLSSPIGFSYIIPPRWMLSLPNWAKVAVAGATAWQWLGLVVGLSIGGLIIWLGHRLGRHRTESENELGPHWRGLLLPLAIILVTGALVPFLDAVMRIAGTARIVIEYARIGVIYVTGAWLAVATSAVLGEVIVRSERLTIRSLDSQLIRLGMRLVGLVAAVAILIRGGDELGLPAYSVLAGLGVGGIAVALAAQSTIANLIGSLLISIEKPFRIGHVVRIGAIEGTVEDVGFRSTRIRTPDNSLLTIPSSSVVSSTVENLSQRPKRRQRFVVQITYDTPREKVVEIVDRIRQLIVEHPMVEADTCQVRFNNFSDSSLDILVIFHLLVEDYATELREREALLLPIMDVVKDAGAEFAFPSRTLYIGSSGEKTAAQPATERLASRLAGRS